MNWADLKQGAVLEYPNGELYLALDDALPSVCGQHVRLRLMCLDTGKVYPEEYFSASSIPEDLQIERTRAT